MEDDPLLTVGRRRPWLVVLCWTAIGLTLASMAAAECPTSTPHSVALPESLEPQMGIVLKNHGQQITIHQGVGQPGDIQLFTPHLDNPLVVKTDALLCASAPTSIIQVSQADENLSFYRAMQQGQIKRSQEKFANALKEFRRAIAATDKAELREIAELHLASTTLDSGDSPRAIELMSKFAPDDRQKNFFKHFLLARAYWPSSKHRKETQHHLDHAIQLAKPESQELADALLLRATMAIADNDSKNAQQILDHVAAFPHRLERIEAKLLSTKSYLTIRRARQQETLAMRLELLSKAVDYELQASALAHAAGDIELQTNVLANAGYIYQLLGNLPQAISAYRAALRVGVNQLNHSTNVLLTNIGNVLLEMGDLVRAEAYLTKAAQLDADLPSFAFRVQCRLGELRRRQGQFETAEHILQPCADADLPLPNRLEGEIALALLNRDRGKTTQASEHIDRAIALLKRHREVGGQLSDVAHLASKIWIHWIEVDPSPDLTEALKNLREIEPWLVLPETRVDTLTAIAQLEQRLDPASQPATLERAMLAVEEPYSQVFIGAEASRKNLFSEASRNADILHIATHGYGGDDNHENVGLILSGPSDQESYTSAFVTLTELAAYPFNNQLVVLSGCDTATGAAFTGEGNLSISRAFLAQGARHVLATLWPVDDRASSIFMHEFYSSLKENLTPSMAVRDAQLALMSTRAYRHPKHWAAYQLLSATPHAKIEIPEDYIEVEGPLAAVR